MNRNVLFLIIGGLIVILAGLGYYVYDKESKPDGIELKIGEDGVSIKEN
jgi:RsiW-degrading membrane proteinase PrsW (M82 family)